MINVEQKFFMPGSSNANFILKYNAVYNIQAPDIPFIFLIKWSQITQPTTDHINFLYQSFQLEIYSDIYILVHQDNLKYYFHRW